MTETQTTESKTTAVRKTAPAKKAPAKTAPAKTAPTPAAKAAPKVATTAPAGRKLRWVVAEGQERTQKGGKTQNAESEGHAYAIEPSGEGWRATHTYEGKTDALVEGKFSAAYTACVRANRERA